MKYRVKVIERWEGIVEVEAKDREEAKDKAMESDNLTTEYQCVEECKIMDQLS